LATSSGCAIPSGKRSPIRGIFGGRSLDWKPYFVHGKVPRSYDTDPVPTTIITDHNEPDSDDEDARPPVHRRKIARKGFDFAGVDLSKDSEDTENPQKKPQGTNLRGHKEKHGVPIGVWKLSDEPNDELKHVVYGFIDPKDSFHARKYPERKDGTKYLGNFPSGTGSWAARRDTWLPDPHLRKLSDKEITEYVRLRTQNWTDHETPEERNTRNTEAVAVARRIVGRETAIQFQNDGDGDDEKPSPRKANKASNGSRKSHTTQTHRSAGGPSPSRSDEIASPTPMLTPITKPSTAIPAATPATKQTIS
jgi:hypothetical protein